MVSNCSNDVLNPNDGKNITEHLLPHSNGQVDFVEVLER